MERFHKPPRSCSFQHPPETIGLIIAVMTDIKEADAPFVLQSTKSKALRKEEHEIDARSHQ
jgi:hypothetical protein